MLEFAAMTMCSLGYCLPQTGFSMATLRGWTNSTSSTAITSAHVACLILAFYRGGPIRKLRWRSGRPVAALSHWVDAVAWRDRPELMHLQNVFWFAVLIAVTAPCPV